MVTKTYQLFLYHLCYLTTLHQIFWVCVLSWLWPVLLKLLSGRKVVLQESTGRWTVTGLLRTWTKFELVEINVANCVVTKLRALTSRGTMLVEGPVIWREARSVKMEPSSKARQLVGLIANRASVIALVFEEKAFQHFFNVILTIYFILSPAFFNKFDWNLFVIKKRLKG